MTARTSLPTPGFYRNATATYELKLNSRGDWYAYRLNPNGTKSYVAQRVVLSTLTGPIADRIPAANDSTSLVQAVFSTHQEQTK